MDLARGVGELVIGSLLFVGVIGFWMGVFSVVKFFFDKP